MNGGCSLAVWDAQSRPGCMTDACATLSNVKLVKYKHVLQAWTFAHSSGLPSHFHAAGVPHRRQTGALSTLVKRKRTDKALLFWRAGRVHYLTQRDENMLVDTCVYPCACACECGEWIISHPMSVCVCQRMYLGGSPCHAFWNLARGGSTEQLLSPQRPSLVFCSHSSQDLSVCFSLLLPYLADSSLCTRICPEKNLLGLTTFHHTVWTPAAISVGFFLKHTLTLFWRRCIFFIVLK